MNNRVQAFLTELYEIDPDLKQSETELAGLIERLLKHNPGQEADERFVEMLRVKLRERGEALSEKPTSFFSTLFMPKFSYGILGAFLGVVITGPAVYYMLSTPGQNSVLPVRDEGTSLLSYKVTQADSRAFGDLSAATNVNGDMKSARPQSGGGGGGMGGAPAIDAAMPQAAEMMQRDGDVANADSKMMIYPPDYTMNVFNYVYKGEDFTLPAGPVSVLKRIKGGLSVPGISALASADLGAFNLSTFPGLKLESFGAYQTTKDGYAIYVNLRDSSVSINQQWDTWDHPESACRDEACYQRFRVKISDVPADDQLVAIADEFLKDHGFTLDNVGTPYVDNAWKTNYEQAADKSQFYIPDQMSVIYPYQVNGKDVQEEFGGKTGVSVSINIRDKKVAGVWNLFDQNYESSDYPAVTDKQQVLDFLAKYEKYAPDPLAAENGMKTNEFEVELGTPTEGYVRMYKYDDKGGEGEDLFVPALIFPVTKQPEGKDLYFYRQAVAVPLAQELLTQRNDIGRPMPMDGPMLRATPEDAPTRPADDAATSDVAE